MAYFLSAFFWLSLSIVMHIIFSKLRVILGVSRIAILGVFIVGLIGHSITTLWLTTYAAPTVSLPYTSTALFVAFSCAYLSITGSPSLGDKSPTTKIIIQLFRHGPQTEKQILSLFTYEEVIGKRINDLIQNKCVRKKGKMFIVTKRGSQIASFFIAYRRLLRLSEGG